ncbi:hypothetical protein NUACC21_42340 [Scytonema sp. NUACC21]
MTVNSSQASLETAHNLNVLGNHLRISDTIDTTSPDLYRFILSGHSSFKLDQDDLSGNADVKLIQDKNRNFEIEEGEVVNVLQIDGVSRELINTTLEAGEYYLQIYPGIDSEVEYTLMLSVTSASDSAVSVIPTTANTPLNPNSVTNSQPTPTSPLPQTSSNGTYTLSGDLRANTFTYQPGYRRTVFLGNGNVDYGTGKRDLMDLSNINFSTVTFNYADTKNGGVLYSLGGNNSTQLFDAIKLSDNSEILFTGIETIQFKDKTVDLSVVPNDPLFKNQSNLHMMGVHNAWRFTQGSDNVVIGIEDTGLAIDAGGKVHPDMRSTIYFGNNYIDELTVPQDRAHGTEVQGVIAAASNNGIGMSGINWSSPVIHVDVMGTNDLGDYSLVDATQAIINQAKGKKVVINLSLTAASTPEFETLVSQNKDNVLFVIASGNSGQSSVEAPANLAQTHKNVMAVGASWTSKDYYGNLKEPGQRITYGNWWSSSYGAGLTLMAPSEIISTNVSNLKSSSQFKFDYEQYFNGTSASVPNVTGIASLVWSVNNNLTAGDIKNILSDTAYSLSHLGSTIEYGSGLVNADAAVRRAIALARGAA